MLGHWESGSRGPTEDQPIDKREEHIPTDFAHKMLREILVDVNAEHPDATNEERVDFAFRKMHEVMHLLFKVEDGLEEEEMRVMKEKGKTADEERLPDDKIVTYEKMGDMRKHK